MTRRSRDNYSETSVYEIYSHFRQRFKSDSNVSMLEDNVAPPRLRVAGLCRQGVYICLYNQQIVNKTIMIIIIIIIIIVITARRQHIVTYTRH